MKILSQNEGEIMREIRFSIEETPISLSFSFVVFMRGKKHHNAELFEHDSLQIKEVCKLSIRGIKEEAHIGVNS